MLSADAAMKEPAVKIHSPSRITGLRPQRSDIMPMGICSAA
eukprot:CAMPEP_0201558870 /NCGR_PEP_ID=MMETSP0173_2-20130828/70503_1 /ASSEMBLY_ACC=CAM_ASM_000268 /TAXON_ID=218659 /ORGANISM="Vexillifera sp., Strain DIVA3 564/2" /LENGTH=40 /DNA_ID= /DNA_START= /DNA_END= /DNA_ORIENTATION=